MDHKVEAEPQTFDEFWPEYLAAHSNARTRVMHVAGTLLGLAFVLVALLTFNPAWLLAALVCAYGAAWMAHFMFQKNVPKTFTHPFWSLRGDFLMAWLTLTGGIDRELRRLDEVAAKRAEARFVD
jgi:hypothetical protein